MWLVDGHFLVVFWHYCYLSKDWVHMSLQHEWVICILQGFKKKYVKIERYKCIKFIWSTVCESHVCIINSTLVSMEITRSHLHEPVQSRRGKFDMMNSIEPIQWNLLKLDASMFLYKFHGLKQHHFQHRICGTKNTGR